MKRLMYLLLTLGLTMLFLTTSYAQDADVDPLKASDVNADGIVNILDLVLVAQHLGETPTEEQHLSSDVNGDSTVNILDLVLVAQHLGESIDPKNEADIKSLYKELVGTYELFKSEVTYVDDQSELVLEPPEFAGTMTISSDQRITQKFGGEIGFGSRTGTFEILTDEGILLIKDDDVTIRATYTWDGTILTITINAPEHVEKIFWRKLNNSVIDLQSSETEPPLPFAEFVRAIPANGSEIATNAVITLVFSSDPGDVVSSAGFVSGSGKTRRVSAPFPAGALTLNITWTNGDGVISLTYTVKVPDNTAPEVTGATVKDGDKYVDPELLFRHDIEITFSEDVSGSIALQTKEGDDVGWIDSIEGNKAALYPVKGKELRGETTYVIRGRVTDSAGNETEVSITFTTAPTGTDHPPTITDGTVSNGDEDVDPELLNILGIRLTFSEDVTFGNIVLQTGSGDDVGWIDKIEGNKVTLLRVFGKELRGETTYVVSGKVADSAGNEREVNIIFTTANYTVASPGTNPPIIIGGNISDGDEDVDPKRLNTDGIEITFSEDVTFGNIVLWTADGDEIGWLGIAQGNKFKLEPVYRKELRGETTYLVRGRALDADGNETYINITFTTAAVLIAEENCTNYWPFVIGKGGIVIDGIGGYNGEIYGAKWIQGKFGWALESKWVQGELEWALEFDGVDDSVVVPYYTTSDLVENITFMARFYPDAPLTNRAFIVKHDSLSVGFGEQTQLKFALQPHDIFVESTNNNWELSRWYHFAVTFDGKTMKIYIDGELNNEVPNHVPIVPSESDLVIGQGFPGTIDEVRVYNKALSQPEIQNIAMGEDRWWSGSSD